MTFSIIIPFYNVQQYTDELLKTLEPQISDDVEVIVVDDGSSEPFHTDYEWVQVIRQENRGPSAARNVGLDRAKGEYIVFIDADDLVAPNYLSKLREIMPFDYVDLSWKSLPGGTQYQVKLKSQADKLLNPSAVTRAFSRACIGDVRFNEKKLAAEDVEFTHTICTEDKVRKVITDYMYFYRTATPNSITKRFLANKLPTKRIVYHYRIVTKDMSWLIGEFKKLYEEHEIVLLTHRCDIPELEKYAWIMRPTYTEGMELRGEPTSYFRLIK